jgi:hypothetical protein
MAFPTGWTRNCALVIQHGQVPADQSAFPVLITEASLPDEMKTSGGSNAAQSDGGDIRFSSDSAGASQLACEVALWTQNATPSLAKAEIWVPVSVLTASDVTIYVWYNAGGGLTQPAASAAFGSEAVWDDNYSGVWHFSESGSVTAWADSTSNSRNGVNSGATSSASGKIGLAASFDGSSQYITLSSPLSFSPFTYSAWVKRADHSTYHSIIGSNCWYRGAVGVDWALDQVSPYGQYLAKNHTALIGSGSTVVSDTTWEYLTVFYDGSNWSFTRNGAANGSGTAAQTLAQTENYIGASVGDGEVQSEFFAGSLDEIRVSNIARSANWILTEYNNQNAPGSFVVAGTPGAVGGGGATTSLFRSSTLSGLGSGGPFFHNPLN